MSIIRHQGPGRGIGASLAAAFAAAMLLALAIVGPALATERFIHLVDAHVSPRFGTATTSIVFTVTYRDAHGIGADSVAVLVDGSARSMTADGGSILADGVHYRLAASLPVGIHIVAFKATAPGGPSFAPAGLVTIRTASGGDGTGSTDPGGVTGGGTTGGGDSPNGGSGGDGGAGASPGTGSGTGGGTGGDAPAGGGTTGPRASADPGTTGDAPGGPISSPGASAGGGAPDSPVATPGDPASGGHTTKTDAPATTGHPRGGGTTSSGGTRTSDAPSKTPHPDSPPTAAPNAPLASAEGGSDAKSEDALALGTGDGIGSSGSQGGPGGDGGGTLTDRTLTALGIGGLTPDQRMVLAAISTTTTTTTIMAFIVFGKRRRDSQPPAPDEVLANNAARFVAMPSATLVPVAAPSPAPPFDAPDSELPRWRRPSLLAARKADPMRSVATTSALTFDHGAATPVAGHERRRIRYRLVRLLDAPDELRSAEIGFLDQGDEVQLLESSGSYWLVLCPDGGRGWLHRMTLGEVVDAAPVETPTPGDAASGAHASSGDQDDEDDLLGAYLRLRHQS